MKTRLRIINRDDIVRNARLLLIDTDDDGNETARDITEQLRITSIDVSLKIGEVSRTKIECICVGAEIDSTLDDLVIRHIGPSHWGQLRWRLTKRWWRQKEITRMGQRYRSYVGL